MKNAYWVLLDDGKVYLALRRSGTRSWFIVDEEGLTTVCQANRFVYKVKADCPSRFLDEDWKQNMMTAFMGETDGGT